MRPGLHHASSRACGSGSQCARPGHAVDQTLVSGGWSPWRRRRSQREDRYEGIARYVRLIDWTPPVRFDGPRRSAGDRRADIRPRRVRMARHTKGGPHEHSRRHPDRDPVVHDRDPRATDRRPAPAHLGDALAHQGTRRRSLAGRAAGDDPGARGLLGERVRLRACGGAAQRAAAVHDRDRRGRDPLHPRQVAARERVAADHDPRLARLGHRAARDRRPADRPDRARRHPRGRIPPGAAVPARLRVLERADRARLGRRPHRTRVGGADAPPRLHPLRRPGRRRGCPRHGPDGPPGGRRVWSATT